MGNESHEKVERVESPCELETSPGSPADVFGNEEEHDIRYKTLSWQVSWSIALAELRKANTMSIQLVSALMIAEIVSNGMLTLPNAMAVVGKHY